jgi:hypothetical protein
MNEFKKTGKILCLLSLIVALSLSACKDALNTDDYKIKRATANPTLNLPIASGDLIINDFLSEVDQANIKVYNDGLIYLFYEQTLKTQGIRDLFDFPSKSFLKSVPIPAAILPARTTEILYATLNSSEDFAFSPEKLTEIKFKTTTVKVTVTFSPPAPASNIFEVELSLPNFQLNGVPFQKRITLGSSTATFPLQDYIAAMANNTFPVQISVFEKSHSSSVNILNSTSASIKIDFTNIDFQNIKGFFGDQSALNIPAETIELSDFGNSLSKANVSFAQPKLSLSVSNDYGIPTKVTFGSLEARKNNGTKLSVTLSPISPVPVNFPATLGQSALTEVTITNATELINFVPNQFYYQLSARINEGLTNGNNFCADTSKVRVTFKAEVPLYGKATGIVLADTFAIDLSKSKSSQVESGAIRSKINNQLPLDALIQLYITDANALIIDSLFTTAQTAIVKASTVNTQGELVNAGVTDNEATIPKEKLDKLFDAKKIIVKVRMNTAKDASGNQIDVKFKSSYKMNVTFGLKAKLKLAVDL